MTNTQTLILKMRALQAEMLDVSLELEKRGISDHAAQLAGAARMLNTLIEGIEEESREEE